MPANPPWVQSFQIQSANLATWGILWSHVGVMFHAYCTHMLGNVHLLKQMSTLVVSPKVCGVLWHHHIMWSDSGDWTSLSPRQLCSVKLMLGMKHAEQPPAPSKQHSELAPVECVHSTYSKLWDIWNLKQNPLLIVEALRVTASASLELFTLRSLGLGYKANRFARFYCTLYQFGTSLRQKQVSLQTETGLHSPAHMVFLRGWGSWGEIWEFSKEPRGRCRPHFRAIVFAILN